MVVCRNLGVAWAGSCLPTPELLGKQHNCGGKHLQAILSSGNKDEGEGKIKLRNKNEASSDLSFQQLDKAHYSLIDGEKSQCVGILSLCCPWWFHLQKVKVLRSLMEERAPKQIGNVIVSSRPHKGKERTGLALYQTYCSLKTFTRSLQMGSDWVLEIFSTFLF